jgi:brefeldin A-inhibited guanine nucleotide-exchange protein
VTSPLCEVHEASLLLAIRACFHIHLITKNQVNKTTAKAALTQMLSAVYQKMEFIDARTKAETEIALSTIADAEELAMEQERGPDKATKQQLRLVLPVYK